MTVISQPASPAPPDRSSLVSAWPPNARVAAAAGHRPISPVEAIRRKCLDCSGYQKLEVKLCRAIACPLWPFRGGVHPYTRKRLQEAVPDEVAADGTPGPAITSSYRNGLLEASPVESGAGELPIDAEHPEP